MNKKDKKMVNDEVKKSFEVLKVLFQTFNKVSTFNDKPDFIKIGLKDLERMEFFFKRSDYNFELMIEKASKLKDSFNRPVPFDENNEHEVNYLKSKKEMNKLWMEFLIGYVKDIRNGTFKTPYDFR